MHISIAAVISAAGSSSRMGGVKKEYLPLKEKSLTVLGAAVSAFASCPRIGPIVISVPPGEEAETRACLPGELQEQKRILFVTGGLTRRASVHNALSLLESFNPSHVLIHDGARPWIKPELIEMIINAVIEHGAVIPALAMIETPKELSSPLEQNFRPESPLQSGKQQLVFIKQHLKRARLCTAQTPQAFRFPGILNAHKKAAEKEERENFEYTDDAEVWGEFIGQVAVIPGDPENRKITYPEDL